MSFAKESGKLVNELIQAEYKNAMKELAQVGAVLMKMKNTLAGKE